MDYILVERFTMNIMNIEYAGRWYQGAGGNESTVRRMGSAGRGRSISFKQVARWAFLGQ